MKKKGFFVVFYSSDFIETAEVLRKELQLDEVIGTELEFKDGTCTGRLFKKVDRYVRAEKIKELVEENNISKEDVFILGDSEYLKSEYAPNEHTKVPIHSEDGKNIGWVPKPI